MRNIFITWAAAWPTITALLITLEGFVGDWPLAFRTLLVTGLMVPLMAFIIVPALNWLLNRLSNNYRNEQRKNAQAVIRTT